MNVSPAPIALSGLGSVSCVGLSAAELFQACLNGRSGILNGLGAISEENLKILARQYPQAAKISRATLIGFAATQEALRQAGWDQLNDDDGFILATTVGEVNRWETNLMDFMRAGGAKPDELSPALRHQPLAALSESLCELLNFKGRQLLVSSACSAATQALALAALWVKQGRVKRCLVGGVEVLCQLTVEGFRSLQLLSPTACTPFDAHRKGINLSEAAAFVCVEKNPARPLAFISGQGFSTDAFHMAAPQPQGQGSLVAMRQALVSAQVAAQDIDWVHAHGTGSMANDSAEGAAIQNLFAHRPWVTSTKWVHGHPLGAAGALETVLCVQALQHQVILKSWGLSHADPSIDLRYATQNISGPLPLRHILKNTLGFGGNNAALVLSAVRV